MNIIPTMSVIADIDVMKYLFRNANSRNRNLETTKICLALIMGFLFPFNTLSQTEDERGIESPKLFFASFLNAVYSGDPETVAAFVDESVDPNVFLMSRDGVLQLLSQKDSEAVDFKQKSSRIYSKFKNRSEARVWTKIVFKALDKNGRELETSLSIPLGLECILREKKWKSVRFVPPISWIIPELISSSDKNGRLSILNEYSSFVDSSTVDIFRQLAIAKLNDGDLNEALLLTEIARVTAEHLSSKSQIADAHVLKSVIHEKNGEIKKSMREIRFAILIFYELEDLAAAGRAFINYGSFAQSIEKWGVAAESFQTSLNIAEDLADDELHRLASFASAGLWRNYGNPQLSLFYYRSCLRKIRKFENTEHQWHILIGTLLMHDELVPGKENYLLCKQIRKTAADLDLLEDERMQFIDETLVNLEKKFGSFLPAINSSQRAWIDKSGNVLVEGTIVDLMQGRLIIRKEAGGLFEIPFGLLHAKDQQHVLEFKNKSQ